MTKLIQKNTTIPTKAQQVFSTADDSQTAVTIHVLQGEREMASGNKSLGQFNLSDIPPAPRGMPQIEVTFDIDSNGILHVSAKDKATGKENKIKIQASSGLSEEEVQRMVKDAEAHAEEDHKAMELVTARNQCDAMIHSVQKTLKEHGDKLDGDEKAKIEAALKDAEEALKSGDKDTIEAKTQALAEASHKLAEKMYAQEQPQQAQQGASKHGQAADTGGRAGMVRLRLVQIAVAGKPAMPAFRPHDEPAHHERDHADIQPGHRITSGWSIETGPPLSEAGVTPIYGRDKEVQFRGTKRNTRDGAVRPPPGRWLEGADATKPRTRGDTDFMR